jgi:putative ABC transport system ATP-binding protein
MYIGQPMLVRVPLEHEPSSAGRAGTVRIVDGVLFEFREVGLAVAGQVRLRDLNCIIPDHGVTVVAGPSGSGKSTLLRLCNRLEVPSAGTVTYRGRDLAAADPLHLRREVGMVFQRPVPLPGTVADNLRAARPDASDDEVTAMLRRVGLAGEAGRDARDLSGGEAQRMCLARTLLTGPSTVLFDEPTSALDPGASSSIESMALDLADRGVPSVWVTHDLDQMRRLAHHLIVLVDGTVAQQGDLDQVLAAPRPSVERFLLGEQRW